MGLAQAVSGRPGSWFWPYSWDKTSFLREPAARTLPSAFSFHCPRTWGTHSQQNTFSPFYHFHLSVLCSTTPFQVLPLPALRLFAHSLCCWQVQLFCELCLLKRCKHIIVSRASSLSGRASHQRPVCSTGTWNSFPSPPMPAQTSCLRRVPITSTQRWYQNVVQPCCLEPKSLLFWSTLLTEPIHGTR